MESILQQIVRKSREQQKQEAKAIKAEIDHPATSDTRRSFLKNTAFGGIALTGFLSMSVEDTIAKNYFKSPSLLILLGS